MKAVILAAGRGSRMGSKTAQLPKCLLQLAGKPLLFWQLSAIRRAGIENVSIVRGYQAHMLTPAALGLKQDAFSCLENPRWAETNMLRTLLCADATLAPQGGIIAYADIVYHSDHVRQLAKNPDTIAITYDTLWEDLWRLRFGDPLLDAETFVAKKGLLQTIGGKPQSIADIEGQYMGLLKVTAKGWTRIKSYCARNEDKLDTMDMTALLQGLLAEHERIGAVPVDGKWCEGDTAYDLTQYEQKLAQGNWCHDWREE